MAARQFSSHQEHYPSRSGGTLGADRKAATALVYQDVVAGVASTVAIQGDDGAIIAIQASALNTDNVIFNAATVYVAALGGGMIYVEESDYNLAATWNVSIDIFVQGAGWDAILNYNAGGNCITITGNNVKIRDLKIVITAGAGAGGTRPNGIFGNVRNNVEISGVWHIGDITVVDDGSDLRQCSIVFNTVTDSRIFNNRFENNERHGLSKLGASNNNIILLNTSNINILDGIRVRASSDNVISNNQCNNNGGEGIRIDQVDTTTVSSNICNGNTISGIIFNDADNCTASNNVCLSNTAHGVNLTGGSSNNSLSSNVCNTNTQIGIRIVAASNNNTLSGNTCRGNTQHGMLVDDSNENIIIGNTCNENDSGDTGSFDGINITDISLDNLVHSNICNDNDRYGINIDDVRALRNWVKNNQLTGNTNGAFNDNIANLTKLSTVPIQFIQGTTFISTAANPWGWEIDLATEFAIGIGWLPLELQQVVRINIIGVGLAAPGANNAMLIELTGEGATFDEVYTTNAIDVANHLSEEEAFAIDDVIHWVFDVTDDAQIGTLLGGDRLQIKVLHNVGVATDIATDAIVDSIQVEYV